MPAETGRPGYDPGDLLRLYLKRLDLFGGELLAIDGSKFRAVNGRDRSDTAPRVAELTRQIDHPIAGYLRELERHDEVEAGTEGPTAETLQGHSAALPQRRARDAKLQQQLASSGATALA